MGSRIPRGLESWNPTSRKGRGKWGTRLTAEKVKRLLPPIVVSLMMAYGCFIAPRLQPGAFALFVPPFLWLAIVSRYPFRYGLVGLWPLLERP